MESDEPAVYCSLDTFPKFNTVEEMLQFDKSMGVATTLPPVVTTVTRTPSWLFRQTFSSDPLQSRLTTSYLDLVISPDV